MPVEELDRPYSQREVQNMLHEQLPVGKHNWLRDPERNPAVEVYGSTYLPSQPVYINYRPSVVKMQLRFTPRRISISREAELWEATEALRLPFKAAKISARRQQGNTQETERDEQWVLNIPERLTEAGYDALKSFVNLAAACMGVASEEES